MTGWSGECRSPKGRSPTDTANGTLFLLICSVSYRHGVVAEDLYSATPEAGGERLQSPVNGQEFEVVNVSARHVSRPLSTDAIVANMGYLAPERSVCH